MLYLKIIFVGSKCLGFIYVRFTVRLSQEQALKAKLFLILSFVYDSIQATLGLLVLYGIGNDEI